MDKSSERGSGQYDPTMDYHWQQFELRRLKGSGEDFQQLFEDIMVRARPGFMRVRPDGNDGDRKCDGLFRQDGIFFQVYSPDELKRIQVRKKINEDLDGAIKHWSAELKTWTFVYNARKGVTPVVLETLQEKQLQYPFIKIDHLSNDGLWEIARGLTLQQRSEIFGAPPSEKRSQTEINWRETCQVLLEQWKGLTTNALTKPDGVQFQLDDVFVPLGVVERRQKPRHAHSEGSPEQGSELYEEKVTPISHYDFFDKVLQQGQSKYSQGRRIAIIGEPGAGKTTQLQKIGDWILQETDGVPIWIPLSAVGEKGLRGYLTQDWLQTAIPELEVTEHHRNDLAQLLKAGKVWLLLDGADEMTVADALQHIAAQMRGMWLQNARVVLTCRLNVWEAGKNALDNFDVYRNLDFEYPDKVHQFIDKCFQDEPNFQQALKAALEQPGKERIRDMAKNPLRLTLLCYSWQIRQGELPETKAGLYEWFVDAFYEWNKGKVPYKLTSAKRKELNQALGELSREAIDQNHSRFRLTEKFIIHFLGDADDEDSLFQLALQLGWLNRIGVAAENPFEGVHAFLHPTFQEYFSALAIHNQDFFLPHEHLDKLAEGKSYRIFEHHWEESFAIWCGRKDKFSHAFHLIQKLTEFRSECSSFFAFRAFFLAAKAEPELNHRKSSEKIINQLIDWAFFTEFSPAISSYWLNCPIPEKAKESLRLTTHNKTILRILKRIESTTNPHYRKELAEFLGTIDRRNTASVKILNELLTSAEHKTVRLGIIESLWTVDPGNLDVIAKLLTLLEDENPVILGFTSKAIRDNKIFTFEILDKLISILKRGEGNFVFELREVLRAIEAFGHGNRYVIDVVIELIEAANRLNNPKNSCILIWTLGEIALKDSKAAEFLMSLLTREKDDPSRWYVAESLGKINVQDQETRNVLIHLTSQEENEWIRQQAAKSLLSIDSNNSGYLYFIVELFKNTRNWRTQSKILEGAEKISSERSKTIDALGACLEASLNDYVKMKTAIVLGKINPGSKKAINTLIKLLENIDNASASNDSIIWNLGEIGEKNSNVAMALISFFERMYKVGRDPGKRGHNQDLSFISRSLCKALDESTYTLAIRRLKAHVSDEAYRNHFEFFKHAYEVIWHCAQNMSYPDFYEAFHWQPVQCESSREETSFNKPYL